MLNTRTPISSVKRRTSLTPMSGNVVSGGRYRTRRIGLILLEKRLAVKIRLQEGTKNCRQSLLLQDHVSRDPWPDTARAFPPPIWAGCRDLNRPTTPTQIGGRATQLSDSHAAKL